MNEDRQRLIEANTETPASRRDFFGIACLGGVGAAAAACVAALTRAVIPRVTPDASLQFKIGLERDFPEGAAINFDDQHVLVFRDPEGFYAVSTTCTHLGCVVAYHDRRGFECPCHGSAFEPDGRVRKGPAPAPLPWFEVSRLPSGQLAVDKGTTVPTGTKMKV